MHVPVMPKEVLEALAVKDDGRYIDATGGGGGHAEAVARALGPSGRLLVLDRDEEAVARVRDRLGPLERQVVVVQRDFAEVAEAAVAHDMTPADGVLFDLGMSSWQLDDPERGFAFRHEGPLDMRLDRRRGATAAELLATLEEKDIADLLYRLGEEHAARRIARAVVARRAEEPLRTTTELADLVARVKGGRRGRIHPATKTFQALRMAVNHELEALERGLEGAFRATGAGARLVVLSFHSLEDRHVKGVFRDHVGRWESLAAGGERWVGQRPQVRWVWRRVRTADEDEQQVNPRARSAKLRAVERVE